MKPVSKHIPLKLGLSIMAMVLYASVFIACTEKQVPSVPTDPMVSEKITEKAVAESWHLLKRAQEMADNGQTTADILKILPDSTLVQTNGTELLFHLKGSVPMLVKVSGRNSDNDTKLHGGGGTILPLNIKPTFLTAATAATYLATEHEEVDVLAAHKGEDIRQRKKALVLSPFKSDFGADDDGFLVREYLRSHRNYKAGIAFKTNGLTLDDYKNFGEFDLVHLSTHGVRFCDAVRFANGGIEIVSGGDSNYCRTLIDTGIKHGFKTEAEINAFLNENPDLKNHIVLADEQISLKSSFFEHFYAGKGLQHKIWVFSACELGQRSDLSHTINNILTDSHLIYWLNSVEAEDAVKTFDAFYKNLITEGLDAKKSFEEIPGGLRSGLPSELNDSIKTTTELLHLQTDKPHHGIEIIEMWHPEDKVPLTNGTFYPVVGDFGDGKDETLTLKVRLKGYSAAAFEERSMSLSLKADDNTVLDRQRFLPDMENNIEVKNLENHRYGVEVTVNDIPIPDVADKKEIVLSAYLHLNDNNFSVHKERVTIKADGVKAIITGTGNRMVLTYDDKNRAQQIQSPQLPSNAYTDEHGYMYVHTPKQGWVKMNLVDFMGKAMLQMPNNAALGNMMENINGNDNLFFPITEWGLRFRKTAFESNPNFSKQMVDCGKAEKCTRFNGIAGEEAGVQALFEPGGRLRELNFNGIKIQYEYGEYNVILPNAKELNMPF